jgi:hypothetical protein
MNDKSLDDVQQIIHTRLAKQMARQRESKNRRRRERYAYVRKLGLPSYYGWVLKEWSIPHIDAWFKKYQKKLQEKKHDN